MHIPCLARLARLATDGAVLFATTSSGGAVLAWIRLQFLSKFIPVHEPASFRFWFRRKEEKLFHFLMRPPSLLLPPPLEAIAARPRFYLNGASPHRLHFMLGWLSVNLPSAAVGCLMHSSEHKITSMRQIKFYSLFFHFTVLLQLLLFFSLLRFRFIQEHFLRSNWLPSQRQGGIQLSIGSRCGRV